MMVIVEQLVESRSPGETEVLGEYLPQRHFVYQKSHMTWPGPNLGRRGGKPATNRLSYGAAKLYINFTLYIQWRIEIWVERVACLYSGNASDLIFGLYPFEHRRGYPLR
jgi:hypothetical protein